MDETDQLILNWIISLPSDAIVDWYSDHLTADNPYNFSLVDVGIRELERLHSFNWVFTILHPEDTDTGTILTTFIWPQDSTIHGTPAWSPADICAALADWAARYAGRTDLVFRWDANAGPSPILVKVQAILDGMKAGTEEAFDMGDGIKISSAAMDTFLEEPEAAAEIMTLLKNLPQ